MNYVHKLQEKMKEQGMDEEYIKLLEELAKYKKQYNQSSSQLIQI